jgi:hypothetical protein
MGIELTDADADAFGAQYLGIYESVKPGPGGYTMFMVSDRGGLRDVEDVLKERQDPVGYLKGVFEVLKHLSNSTVYKGLVDAGVRVADFSLSGEEIKSKFLSSLRAAAQNEGFEATLDQALSENNPLS